MQKGNVTDDEDAPGTLTKTLSAAFEFICDDDVSDHDSRCCTSMDLHQKGRTTGSTHPVAARDEDQGKSHQRSPLIPFPDRMPSITAGIGKLVWPHNFKLQLVCAQITFDIQHLHMRENVFCIFTLRA